MKNAIIYGMALVFSAALPLATADISRSTIEGIIGKQEFNASYVDDIITYLDSVKSDHEPPARKSAAEPEIDRKFIKEILAFVDKSRDFFTKTMEPKSYLKFLDKRHDIYVKVHALEPDADFPEYPPLTNAIPAHKVVPADEQTIIKVREYFQVWRRKMTSSDNDDMISAIRIITKRSNYTEKQLEEVIQLVQKTRDPFAEYVAFIDLFLNGRCSTYTDFSKTIYVCLGSDQFFPNGNREYIMHLDGEGNVTFEIACSLHNLLITNR